jgi:hypothetical protein
LRGVDISVLYSFLFIIFVSVIIIRIGTTVYELTMNKYIMKNEENS